MGRIIGDDGLFYQVVDIAVSPSFQGKGIGKTILSYIMEYLNKNALPSAYVYLIADGNAQFLYKKYGFMPTALLRLECIFAFNSIFVSLKNHSLPNRTHIVVYSFD